MFFIRARLDMSSFIDFVKDSYIEFREKVEWPTWDELQSSVIIVAISSLLLAVFTFGVDTVFGVAIKNLYSLFISLFN